MLDHKRQPEYLSVRKDTLDTIDDYVIKGLRPGSFVYSVLTNDLMGAVLRADEDNLKNLAAICAYVRNEIPAGAWGSPEAVAFWIAKVRKEKICQP